MDAKISRRKFLQISALAAGATMLPMPVRWLGTGNAQAFAQSPPLLKKDAYKLRGLALPPMVLGLIPNNAFFANDTAGIPVLDGTPDPAFANTLKYNVTASEFTDQLHPGMGPTRLWGYRDTASAPANQKHLGGVIIAARGTATRIRMTNALTTDGSPTGPALNSIIPVDNSIPGTGLGVAQNRIAVHLHGGYIPWISDGGPFDWWTPNNAGGTGLSFKNGPGSLFDTADPMVPGQADYYYPNDQSTRLMWYHDHAHGITRTNAYAGVATGYLCLDLAQETALGTSIPPVTSLVPLVFQDKIFVNGDPVTGTLKTDPTWATVAPARVQTPGSLWYAHIYDPKLYRLKKGRGFLTPPDPSCVPEFFGDTMLCNGTVAPVVEVEPRRFRFMLLNACNARFFNINMLQVQANCEVVTNPKTGLPASQYNYVTNTAVAALPTPGPQIMQIGTEGGYLQNPVTLPAVAPTAATGNIVPFNPATFSGNLIVGNAERADFIIDFSAYAPGTEFVFYNDSPGPFPAGAPTNDYYAGNVATPAAVLGSTVDTRNILRFRVIPFKAGNGPDPQVGLPTLPAMDPLPLATAAAVVGGPLTVPANTTVRDLTLNEDFDPYGRLRQLIGTTKPALVGKGFGLDYLAPATEIIAAGTPEVWRVFNLTADTHPLHFHLQTCQIVSRQPFKIINGRFTPTGVARGPEPNEMGWKETVRMNPGEVTSVIFKWDMSAVPFTVPFSDRTMGDPLVYPGGIIPQANEFVYHCHILEHEEHDMMRPLVITGVNPQRPNIKPTSAAATVTGAPAPLLLNFTVSLAPGSTIASISATSSDPAYPAPAAVTSAAGFDVTLPTLVIAPATPIKLKYEVTDSTGLKSSITITAT
jgi:spore coat protein A